MPDVCHVSLKLKVNILFMPMLTCPSKPSPPIVSSKWLNVRSGALRIVAASARKRSSNGKMPS